jgi:dTDP-glucose pyrophosphorylase
MKEGIGTKGHHPGCRTWYPLFTDHESDTERNLPIVDKPTIQYIVEEAVAIGIEDIIIVTGKGKRARRSL